MGQTALKQTVFSKRTLICICTGFSSGLPFTYHTLEEAIIKPFTEFYIDMGFSNTEIGLVAKTAARITQNNSRT